MSVSGDNADKPHSPGAADSQPATIAQKVLAVDVDNLQEETIVPEKDYVKEPSLPMIGFQLSKFVLWIISAFILLLVLFLFIKQFDASGSIKVPEQANIPDSTYGRKLEVMRIIQEEKKNYRDFTLQIAQMILLNLLLPVLTAILGYIFASTRNKE